MDARESGKHLSDVNIGKILGLAKAIMSQRKIVNVMKCSRKAVQNILVNYLFETFQGRGPRCEYERKTSQHEDHYIEHALKQNCFLPLKDITNKIRLPISETTIHHRRDEAGLKSYIAAEKPGLQPENVAERLEWALCYKDWTVEDWKCVIWSDECSIWIGVNPQRQWVIRPQGERLNPKYVKKTFKGSRVKVMVWACFSGERLGPLIVCDDEAIDGEEYEDILYDGLFSLIDDLLNLPEDPDTIQVAEENTFLFM